MARQRMASRLAAALGFGLMVGPPSFIGGGASAAAAPAGPDGRRPGVEGEALGDRLARQDVGGPAGGAMRPQLGAGPPLPGTELTREEILRIDEELLENILRVQDPSERSLALVQAARYKIITRDLDTARRALDEAADSAVQIPDPLRRDLRLISTSKAFVDLAEEDVNAAVSGVTGVLSLEPEMTVEERVAALEQALAAFDRSAELAARVRHDGYRPDAMYYAVERQAQGGQSIGIAAFRDPGRLENPGRALPELRRLAGLYVERAAGHARSITNPVWRDVALTAVASAAATSNQFDLAREVARSVPGPELRFQALLTVAEAETRRGTPDLATADYAEAARTLASLPIADLRGTLNDVLIESLIAAGRFPDARRCVALYADDVDRMDALGAIAQSMGSRGLSDEARAWIADEIQPSYRDQLYRRVNQGVLSTLERYGNDSYLGSETF